MSKNQADILNEHISSMQRDQFDVDSKMHQIVDALDDSVTAVEFGDDRTEKITTMLAILELAFRSDIALLQEGQFGTIKIMRRYI